MSLHPPIRALPESIDGHFRVVRGRARRNAFLYPRTSDVFLGVQVDTLDVFRLRMPAKFRHSTHLGELELRAAWDPVEGVLYVTSDTARLDWYVLALAGMQAMEDR